MKISEVATKYGISKRTLRYYEEIGILVSIRKPGSDYRYYDATVLKRLEQILLLRNLDFPINKISEILLSQSNDLPKEIFNEKYGVIQEEIDLLVSLKQVIASIIKLNDAAGTASINVYEILKEQIYVNRKIERVLAMDQYIRDVISIEFGTKLIPCADKLIAGIKALRRELETQFKIEIPLIRIRDNVELLESSYQILIKGIVTSNENFENLNDEDIPDKMLSALRNILILNLNNLVN